MDAINAGYDEITHINWIMMQAMPDDVIKVSNGIMRFEGPGRYAKDVDLDGPCAQDDRLDDGGEEHLQRSDDGRVRKPVRAGERRLSPSYAPFVGTMPPTTERGFRTAGSPCRRI